MFPLCCVCEEIDKDTQTKGEKRESPEYLKVQLPVF